MGDGGGEVRAEGQRVARRKALGRVAQRHVERAHIHVGLNGRLDVVNGIGDLFGQPAADGPIHAQHQQDDVNHRQNGDDDGADDGETDDEHHDQQDGGGDRLGQQHVVLDAARLHFARVVEEGHPDDDYADDQADDASPLGGLHNL